MFKGMLVERGLISLFMSLLYHRLQETIFCDTDHYQSTFLMLMAVFRFEHGTLSILNIYPIARPPECFLNDRHISNTKNKNNNQYSYVCGVMVKGKLTCTLFNIFTIYLKLSRHCHPRLVYMFAAVCVLTFEL